MLIAFFNKVWEVSFFQSYCSKIFLEIGLNMIPFIRKVFKEITKSGFLRPLQNDSFSKCVI